MRCRPNSSSAFWRSVNGMQEVGRPRNAATDAQKNRVRRDRREADPGECYFVGLGEHKFGLPL